MTRKQMADWLSANVVKIVGAALTIGVTWGVLTAAVRDKADQAGVDSLRVEVRQTARDADRERDELRRLVCRIPEVGQDSACDRYRR